MTSLAETLSLFKDNVVGGTLRAPDNYPDWNTLGYTRHLSTSRDADVPGARFDQVRRGTVEDLPQRP